MQNAVAHSPSMQTQKLSDASEHLYEDCHQLLYESVEENSAAVQKHGDSTTAYTVPAETATSEGLTLNHLTIEFEHKYHCVFSYILWVI